MNPMSELSTSWMSRHTQSSQNGWNPSTDGPPTRGACPLSHGAKERATPRAACSYTARYCSKLMPPPIQSLLGSFQTHQYQFLTFSPPHSSMQLQTISEHCSANRRTARGSSNGRGNLAKVTNGVAPTFSAACM